MSDAEKKNGTIYYVTDDDYTLSIDSSLSSTSKNPIQNKVVSNKFAEIETSISSAKSETKTYTDTKIANLINGAPETLDTLKEVADAITASKSVEEALNKAIGTKANDSDLSSHTNDNTIHINKDERKKWNTVSDKVDKVSGKVLSSNDYTTLEKNKLAGISEGANKYIHPTYTSKTVGFYKVSIDSTGHVSTVESVTKDDIVNLGIPEKDTNSNYPIKHMSSADYNNLSEAEKKNGTIYLVD